MSIDPTPWTDTQLNDAERMLEERTRANMRMMRRVLFYPFPGIIIPLWLLKQMFGWGFLAPLISLYGGVWLAVIVWRNWDAPLARSIRENVWTFIWVTLLRREPRAAEEPEVEAFMASAPVQRVNWPTLAQDNDHQAYRDIWERLARKGLDRSTDDDLTMAQAASHLRKYGDDPTAVALSEVGLFPPHIVEGEAPRDGQDGIRPLFGAAPAAAGLLGGGLLPMLVKFWPFVVIPALLGLVGLKHGEAENAKRERDATCTQEEIAGATTREACVQLAGALQAVDAREHEIADLNAQLSDTAGLALEAETRREALQGELDRIRRNHRERERLANARIVEDARTGAAPDWDARLRDIATPSADQSGDENGTAPADPDPGRGMPFQRTTPSAGGDAGDPPGGGGADSLY